MHLDEVQAFKREAKKIIFREMINLAAIEKEEKRVIPRCPPAVGIHPSPGGEYQLAVRARNESDLPARSLQQILSIAHRLGGEIDLRYTGNIELAARCRPLTIGASIGQASDDLAGAAGTLGCFVYKRGSSELLLLSNRHVIAFPRSEVGQYIIQPGGIDGGISGQDNIAELVEFIAPQIDSPNKVDAAIAKIFEVDGIEPDFVGEGYTLQGARNEPELDIPVIKVGRTTDITHGKISAFEMEVYLHGTNNQRGLMYEGQIEIEGTEEITAFCEPGDSGSLILDSEGFAIGLLFARSEYGNLTYANPINWVLTELDVELALGRETN